MIGTGASAIQIVPGIIDEVAELQLYQRTLVGGAAATSRSRAG